MADEDYVVLNNGFLIRHIHHKAINMPCKQTDPDTIEAQKTA